MLFIVALDRRRISLTVINYCSFEKTIAADRVFEKPQRCLFITLCRQQKVNGLAMLIDRTI